MTAQNDFLARSFPQLYKLRSAVPRVFKHRLLLGLITVGACLAISVDAYAVRTVKGVIKDRNGNPAPGLRVKALDYDWSSSDDEMGTATTDANGYYEIHYAGGHWDPAPHWWTAWRP